MTDMIAGAPRPPPPPPGLCPADGREAGGGLLGLPGFGGKHLLLGDVTSIIYLFRLIPRCRVGLEERARFSTERRLFWCVVEIHRYLLQGLARFHAINQPVFPVW